MPGEGGGQASACGSTEVASGWEGQSRPHAEDASEAPGPGGGWYGGGERTWGVSSHSAGLYCLWSVLEPSPA
jgi:hypothetical protein